VATDLRFIETLRPLYYYVGGDESPWRPTSALSKRCVRSIITLVEMTGIEPATSALQGRRSPN
jgi:hypothetical protein